MKRIGCLLLALAMLLGCTALAESAGLTRDVVVLFTSDAHCGIDQGFGYAGLAAMRDSLEAAGNYVVLVDNGDAIQGEPIGTLTTGEAIIELMNTVGYDIAIPGNHEFDYGMDRVLELTAKANFPYISANFNKEGELVFDDRADSEEVEAVLEAIAAAGFTPAESSEEAATEPDKAPESETEEAVSLTVSVPAAAHTGATLRNLVNLLYTRASLLKKALGTGFRVDEGLTEALQNDDAILTAEAFRKAVAAYEDEHGKAIDGLTIEPDKLTFSPLPETEDTEKIRTFTTLCAMMNKMALDQKRIQAKAVNEENEKYALRIWLTRLGMNGPEHKEARRVLMENLTGHCALRTEADKLRWQERQAAKRDALRAAKAETEVSDDETAE